MMKRSWISVAALLVSGCASRPAPAPVTVAAVPLPAPAPVLPAGASPGMLVPAALPDGSYPTPNQHVSVAAAVWHLRSGLNVAALACPAEQGASITAGYNALLATHRAELKAAEARYSAEYRSTGDAGWQDRYDDAMTRLYNFFSQTPARAAFCAAAVEVTATTAAVPVGGLGAVATAELGRLDRPFADFYRAYDAWRMASVARTVIAVSASTPAASAPQAPSPGAAPRLELDLSRLPAELPSGG